MSDKQIALDQMGGDPRKVGNAEDDMMFLREGGQTDYRSPRGEPFDQLTTRPRTFDHRFIDVDLQPVPIACQEDRSLVVYDYIQKQYNINLTGGATTFDGEVDVVERGWLWLPERVSIFGTATGFVQLFDGASNDGSNCFATQAGVAALLGGVQSVSGIVMTPGTPLRVKAIGVDANSPLAIGIWYRKAKWVWSPPKFIQRDTLTAEKEQRGVDTSG